MSRSFRHRRNAKPNPHLREGADLVVEGRVARVRFGSDDGAFQVVVIASKAHGQVTAVVRDAALEPGELLSASGRVERHSTGELQLAVKELRRQLPSTEEGLVAYLGSGQISGVGPAMAERIVAAFGDDTLRVLDEEPERLAEVAGLGPKRVASIQEAWGSGQAARDVMIFLRSQGISGAYASRILEAYGQRAVAVVRADPYRLSRDIDGIGFRTADRIAQSMGVALDDLRRARAGVDHILDEAGHSGHVFAPMLTVVESASALLEAPLERVEEAVAQGVADGSLIEDQHDGAPTLYRRARYDEERELARRLAAHAGSACRVPSLSEEALASIEGRLGFTLADGQRRALSHIVGAPLAVLTGGPGTGKTTIVRAVVDAVERHRLRYALAAPTGRAAQRLSESTQREASTLHRLLGFDPRTGRFTRDAREPLETDVVVCDEASMVDQRLMLALTRAMPKGAMLLLVGDNEQLPSVGAGDVLAHVIESGAANVAVLESVFRQGEHSGIVRAAHAIRAGRMEPSSADRGGDYFLVRSSSPETVAERIVTMVTERMPSAFGLDPIDDIQVLVPMHRGPVGTQALNEALQAALGVGGPHLQKGERRLHVGDKVMQRRNDYKLEVYNGDIGRIVAIDVASVSAVVRFGSRHVTYRASDLDSLELAYAITVHKSQGSEFPAVVLGLTMQHYTLLQRHLLYTGVTRAKERLVLVGDPRAFDMAVGSAPGSRRFTALADRVREAFDEIP